MGRGKKRGPSWPTAARATGSYQGSSRYAATAARSRSKEPTRDFIEHATILKKLFPKAGEPERDTGWTISKARNEANGETVTLIGTYGPVEEGQLIAIKNDLKKDPPWQDGRYGAEYKVWALDHGDGILATRAGLKSYLDNLPGVGDKLSDAIIDTFQGVGSFDGAAILAHIDEDPTRLNQVRGAHGHAIRADLDELVKKWAELREERKEMLFLGSLEIGHSTANRIRKHFRERGIDPVAAVKHDPYVLVEVDGVGFRIADAAAKSRGVAFDDPRRLVAGLNYVLDEAKDRDSHICLTREQLVQKAPYTLTRDHRRPPATLITKAIDDAVSQGRLVSYTDAADGIERIYTTQMYLVETRLYEQLNRLLLHEKLELPPGFETGRPNTSPVTEEQWKATVNCFHEKISILTGGPGCGKTYSLRVMLEELDKQGHKYLCLAPTGKAAKRMLESTGRPASTIHRALGLVNGLTPPKSMTEEPHTKLDVDVVVVDEVSMLDAELAERLLSHLHDRTRIVFVGDPDQLPPVGPGSVLLDLIEADRVPTAKLTQVFRQAEGSLLIVNAHRIKDGLEPFWSKAEAETALGHPVKEDFVVLEVGSAAAARDTVIDQVDLIAQEIGISPKEVLVCAPFRKGEAGVWKLNSILQDRHNPRGEQIRGGEEKPLRVNDIVMNTSNRYARRDQPDEYDVMNGDMGRIESWDLEKKLAMIDFGDGEMKFQGDDLDKVVPAYAATIHKLQGSQGPGLVLPLTGGQASSLISRNHVYTGMTRAEEKCVMVVDDKKTLLEVLSRQFKRETTLDLRVGRIEKRLKAAWEQVRDFESKWQEHLRNRDLPKLSRPSSLSE